MFKPCMRGICAVVLIVGVSGCISHQVLPLQESIETPLLERKPKTAVTVAIIPVHNPTAQQWTVCSLGAHTYYARPDDLTDAAETILGMILKRNGMQVDPNSSKTLRIAVVDAGCEMPKFVGPYKYYVKLEVQVGDKEKRQFVGTQHHAHVFGTGWAIARATSHAIVLLLQDEEIIQYLEK